MRLAFRRVVSPLTPIRRRSCGLLYTSRELSCVKPVRSIACSCCCVLSLSFFRCFCCVRSRVPCSEGISGVPRRVESESSSSVPSCGRVMLRKFCTLSTLSCGQRETSRWYGVVEPDIGQAKAKSSRSRAGESISPKPKTLSFPSVAHGSSSIVTEVPTIVIFVPSATGLA